MSSDILSKFLSMNASLGGDGMKSSKGDAKLSREDKLRKKLQQRLVKSGKQPIPTRSNGQANNPLANMLKMMKKVGPKENKPSTVSDSLPNPELLQSIEELKASHQQIEPEKLSVENMDSALSTQSVLYLPQRCRELNELILANSTEEEKKIEITYASTLIACTMAGILKEMSKAKKLTPFLPAFFRDEQDEKLKQCFQEPTQYLISDLVTFGTYFIIKAHDFAAQLENNTKYEQVVELKNVHTSHSAPNSTPIVLSNFVDHVDLWNWINTMHSYPDFNTHLTFTLSEAEQKKTLETLLINRQIRIVSHLFSKEVNDKQWKVTLNAETLELLYKHMKQDAVDSLLLEQEKNGRFKFAKDDISSWIKKAKKRVADKLNTHVTTKNIHLISDEVLEKMSQEQKEKYLKKQGQMELAKSEALEKRKQFDLEQEPLALSCTSDMELAHWDSFTRILKNVYNDWSKLCMEQLYLEGNKLRFIQQNGSVPLQLLYLVFPDILKYFDHFNTLYYSNEDELNENMTWWHHCHAINEQEQLLHTAIQTIVKQLPLQ